MEALRQRIRATRPNLPDAPDVAALQRLGDEDLERQLGTEPRADGLDVRLHGKGVVDHQVPVRKATAILSSIQETVTVIGQAVTRTSTRWRPLLGQYPDRTVDATLRELVTWSTATGVEKRTYELVAIIPTGGGTSDLPVVGITMADESTLESAP